MPRYTCDFRNPYVYDKAKYHYDADDFPEEYPIEQAYVHTGLFVGWLADNGLLDTSDPVTEDLIAQYKRRELPAEATMTKTPIYCLPTRRC